MAGQGAPLKLYEHPDFEQAVIRAGEHFRMRPALIEKDYYVTEVLRIIAGTVGDKAIFKGGTSLSKGWDLIERFSEDIDIFLDPAAFKPTLGKGSIDRELKKLKEAIGKHPALTFTKEQSKTIGGFGRNDRYSYKQRFAGPGAVVNSVLVETGTASGREPTVTVTLRSYLAKFLLEAGPSLDAEDEEGFPFRLLHFRRTFVEKLFAIHAKVELFKREKRPLGSYARHYYDLSMLAAQPEVLAMLRSTEYSAIKQDYDLISRKHFSKGYFPPDGMSFAKSDALFPPAELAAAIRVEYEQQCNVLCYGQIPSWARVQAQFHELRPHL